MTALNQYARYIIKGTGIGSEIWQTTFAAVYTVGSEPSNAADLQVLCDAVATRVATWWTSVKATVCTGWAMTELHAYDYLYPSTVSRFGASHVFTPVAGTQASAGSPVDTCCVVSLRTGFTGASHRGRMYVPCHATAQPTTGLFTTPPATISAATGALFTGIFTDGDQEVVVVSQALGNQDKVTAVACDQKPDVQRRRENRMSGGTATVTTI